RGRNSGAWFTKGLTRKRTEVCREGRVVAPHVESVAVDSLSRGGDLKNLAAVISLVFLAAVTALAQVTVIKAGKLIQPDEGTVASDQVIVIRANKIEAVGSGLAIPAGATVIGLSKMTVLPGLSDCHTQPDDGK